MSSKGPHAAPVTAAGPAASHARRKAAPLPPPPIEAAAVLARLGLAVAVAAARDGNTAGDRLTVCSPIDGSELACLPAADVGEVDCAVARAHEAFLAWRRIPPPRRGELVRRFGSLLREHQDDLGRLVTLESGKIASEGRGEVQEMIDICDFALGLSRQLYGLTIASERPGHRMMETWHPLGVCAVVTAFNFPAAVWAWNAAIALVCGNALVWKPSERTPLTALACQHLLEQAAAGVAEAPPALSQVLPGGAALAMALADHPRVALLSATGSTAMGRTLAPRVAGRLGRSLLELGGNNGMIVTASADLDLAVRAITFAAVGTAGQRCTSLRRLFVHADVADALLARLTATYASLPIGDPRAAGTLVGPLIDAVAGQRMRDALSIAHADGGRVFGGETCPVAGCGGGHYVHPAIVDMPAQTAIVRQETFAPILYLLRYRDFDAALAAHNAVPQGLASAVFTRDLREAERFLAVDGSDCGIANVNIGPSGAEIGGAFGGEKDTGGGRESGSDAWKAYMRRATNTINYSDALPLAQGVQFL